VELFAADAPLTVENFVNLARAGFYDGTTFHRVIPGFMAQGGDPTGSGSGGPGYQFRDELSSPRRHDGAGVLSMANAGPNTNGSQFFITFGPTPHLDGKHTVFGRVTDSMDVVAPSANATRRATEPGDRIERIEIRRHALAAPKGSGRLVQQGVGHRRVGREVEARPHALHSSSSDAWSTSNATSSAHQGQIK
jgi:cyclophilin family peptidyl-prolyl cis-trans isomerase